MDELISVIVPIYNVKNYIARCIDSIISQTYVNLEIILIDDGSNDGSGEICDKYSLKDSRIRVVHKANEGVSKARNLGLSIAKGKYIGFVDGDDYIEFNMYDSLLENMKESNADLSVCSFYREYKGRKLIHSNTGMRYHYDKNEALELLMQNDNFDGYLWNKLFKSDIIKNEGLGFRPDIHWCEDLLFVCAYITKIKSAVYDDIPLYYYIQRGGGVCNGNTIDQKKATMLTAFSELFKLLKLQHGFSIKRLEEKFLIQNLVLKVKIFESKDFHNQYLSIINQNIGLYKKNIFTNPNISLKQKINLFVKCYLPRIYIMEKKKKKVLECYC